MQPIQNFLATDLVAGNTIGHVVGFGVAIFAIGTKTYGIVTAGSWRRMSSPMASPSGAAPLCWMAASSRR